MPTPSPTVIVIAGGASRRFGANKLAAPLGGSTVLDATLDSTPPEWPVICVGPTVATDRPVTWTREDPPGAGPGAAVRAGVLTAVHAESTPPYLAVVAGDMPHGGRAFSLLLDHLVASGKDGCLAVDESGHAQYLLGIFRTPALVSALDGIGAAKGLPVRNIYKNLNLANLQITGVATRDIDTPDDLKHFDR